MSSPKSANVIDNPLQIVGYVTPVDNRNLITSIVMEDPKAGIRFASSVCEVIDLVNKGKAVLPQLNETGIPVD